MRTVMGVTFTLVVWGGIGKWHCLGGNCVKETGIGTGHVVWVVSGSAISDYVSLR